MSVTETGAIFNASPAGEASLVVSVHGDIDMRSAPILADYAGARVAQGVRLILDLSCVDFFGIAGLRVFAALDDAAAAAGTTWCLVEGHPVHRLLEAANAVPAVQRFTAVADAVV
ncbi:STAS domain-containing protein [Rhodococcoides kyotonense]|uniref:STAS domain-containing protein n=1 Tax=Rhodococcoides kyotonense TaxID=398843 RepID=UPI001FE9FACE|nr:STAS domain-containing protein [Rhodococcus kyotonensis]